MSWHNRHCRPAANPLPAVRSPMSPLATAATTSQGLPTRCVLSVAHRPSWQSRFGRPPRVPN
eukprot:9174096-Alexandrium_andersonii.AAC.1